MEHRPGFGHHLRLVREIEHPEGRKRNRELDEDRTGDSFHHEHTSHQNVEERFVHDLARELERARVDGVFSDLILVAEPKFLGLLRHALDSTTAQRVVGSVAKDLAAIPAPQVAEHIADVLPL
jgi:protein required for attachment to host cells